MFKETCLLSTRARKVSLLVKTHVKTAHFKRWVSKHLGFLIKIIHPKKLLGSIPQWSQTWLPTTWCVTELIFTSFK